jgi:hypothetical protein
MELHLHSSTIPSWRGAQLKYRNKFNFYFSDYFKTGQHSKEILVTMLKTLANPASTL